VRIPSVRTLCFVTVGDRKLALKVRKVLDGRLKPSDASDAAAKWASSCYHRPRETGHEMILEACDHLLDGCGVEAIKPECEVVHYDDGIRMCPAFSYVNMGDAYEMTILRDHEASCWLVMSWADAMERHEKRCASCRQRMKEDSDG